jgi:hypothetical protein
MGHPPRIPVWLRWDQSVIYFVTICVADRKPVLANRAALDAFKLAASKLQQWHVLGLFSCPITSTFLSRQQMNATLSLEIFRPHLNAGCVRN